MFSVVLFICALALTAQDKKASLKHDKEKIEEEIQFNTKLLSETKQSKKVSLNQLILLRDQIKNREKLIQTMNAQFNQVNKQIDLNNELLKDLQQDLNKLTKKIKDGR